MTLFSSPRCTLCEPVKELLIEAVERSSGRLALTVVDISRKENSEHFFRYCHDIPVVHLDGKEIARHTLTQDVLEKALERCT